MTLSHHLAMARAELGLLPVGRAGRRGVCLHRARLLLRDAARERGTRDHALALAMAARLRSAAA